MPYVSLQGFFPFTYRLTTSMSEHPESFPVNALVPIPGTPMESNEVSYYLQKYYIIMLSIRLACLSACSSTHNRDCQNRPSNYDNPLGRRPTDLIGIGTSNVLLVGCQRGLHWRADVDHTMFVLPTTISRFSGK